MRAVILAAGYGRRMRPLTDDAHKTLLPVAGTTILGRIVDGLHACGVRDVTVATGWRADDVRAYLAERYPAARFDFVHNDRFRETNNIATLALVLAVVHAQGDVILIESDLIYEPALIERLVAAPPGNVALVDRYRPGMDGTVVAVDAAGAITHIFPPHLQGADFRTDDKWKTLNIYRFTRDFWNGTLRKLITVWSSVDESCYYEHVLGMIIYAQRERIRALATEGARWAEVDDPNDLSVARFIFNADERPELLERARGGFWSYDVLDFSLMRNARFPTPAIVSTMRQFLPALLTSYGSSQVVLNEKLSRFLLCGPERVQLLNGASQAFPLLRELLGGRAALLPSPTFGEFPRAFPRRETYIDGPGIDWAEVESKAARAGLVVFVNPNNPTGTTLGTGAIHAFAARHAERLVLVDESFVDFSGETPLQERLEREPLPNVLVLKSLGKSLGAPGLRMGFLYACDPALLGMVGARLPIWNSGALAEHFLELLLKFRNELLESFEAARRDRAELARLLAESGAVERVHPSGGNFVLVELRTKGGAASGAAVARELLARHAIHVKDVSARLEGDRARLRFAVRLPDENRRLAEGLAAVVEGLAP